MGAVVRSAPNIGGPTSGVCPACWLHLSVITALVALALTIAAQAQTTQIQLLDGETVGQVTIPINKSQTVRLDRSFAEVLVGSSDIADVLPLTERSIYILGQSVGTTNISIVDAERRILGVIEVTVTLDVPTIERRIHEATGNRNIQVSDDGGQLVLSGAVHDAPSADRAMQIATRYSDRVVNAMDVTSTQQVMLKVRFVEATRRAARDLGMEWQRIGSRSLIAVGDAAVSASPTGVVLANLVNSNRPVDVLIQALEERGHARNLAEPNLVAMSGDTASFLAGGEFPFQVATRPEEPPAIEFKEFGVRLSFTPTVLMNGQINMILEPEVSSLDFSVPGDVPALNTRRARTTIELRDGQSFAIAGLFEAESSRSMRQLPWLGRIPVLGALFRSTQFSQRETDLVIIVTPHLVKPAGPGDDLQTPLDRSLPPSDPELFIGGHLEIPKDYRHYVERGIGVTGPYGHMLGYEFGYTGLVGKGRAE